MVFIGGKVLQKTNTDIVVVEKTEQTTLGHTSPMDESPADVGYINKDQLRYSAKTEEEVQGAIFTSFKDDKNFSQNKGNSKKLMHPWFIR